MRTSKPTFRVPLAAITACWFLAMAGAPKAEVLGDDYHRGFDAVLRANVSAGHVNYPGIAADARFHDYVRALQAANVDGSSPAEQLAFWVNAYNALAIQGILNGRSPSTFLGRRSYFERDEFRVAGREMTLYDLEHEVILPLGDNRIHFAIVCASASCPSLRSEAYVPSAVDQQLEEQARLFVNDTTKNAYDLDRERARISKIFAWFEEDFTADAGSLGRYIARFVDDPAIAAALAEDRLRVKFRKYDWSLNGTPPET